MKTTLTPDSDSTAFDSTFADHWRGRFEGHPGKFRVFLFEPETELLAPFLCSLECAIAFLESENTDSDFAGALFAKDGEESAGDLAAPVRGGYRTARVRPQVREPVAEDPFEILPVHARPPFIRVEGVILFGELEGQRLRGWCFHVLRYRRESPEGSELLIRRDQLRRGVESGVIV